MDTIKNENYDVVIIGSGLGGLTAATFLSRNGFKTLVVESLSRVGGRFSTIEHEGFKLPTGAILIPDGWVTKFFKEMDIDFNLLRPLSRVYYRIEGIEYEIPTDMGILKVLGVIDELEREKAKSGRKTKSVGVRGIARGYYKKMKAIKQEEIITVRDWLLQYTENEKIHEVFDNLCAGLMMAHSWELPVSKFFLFQEMTNFFVAINGNLSIVKELVKIIEKNGAVWTSCPARKILIKEGKASGIIVEKDGQQIEIQSKFVISDIGPRMTVELAGLGNFDEEYLKNMRVKLRPSPAIMLLVASDKPLCLKGTHDALQIIMGGRRIRTVVPISNVCPEVAPPGQHLFYTSAELQSCTIPNDLKYEIDLIKRDLKDLFPDFEQHGRILKIRACTILSRWPEGRTWLGYGLPLETTIPNLFNVGDGCVAPGLIGTTGSVESGYRVVELIENLLKD